jgi:hypothetical protein
MAGITFPNVAGTLAPLMQLDLAAERNAFDRERARRADEADTREREASQHVPAALGGDREALSRIAVASPGLLTKLVPMLDRMDAAARTRAKEATEWTARAAMGVLSLPPDQRPAAYQAALAEGQSLGFKIDMPPQYDRAVEGRLNQILNQTRTFENYWKDKKEGVTFAPPAGGAPGGDRSANAIAGIESGGRYDAVGPVANPKGQRAYGKYQIMDFNVGPWTQEVLGTAMTPQQFLASPQAQDAVFKAKFGQYAQKYGSPEAAARAWFAGEGGMNNPGATDVLGTTVQGYGQKFAQAYGPGATGPQIAQGDSIPGSPASGGGNVPPAMAPLRGLQLPPGARVALKGGLPVIQDGTVLYLDANGGWGAVPLPQRAAPKEQGTGPFGGNSVEAQALNMLIANGTLTQAQAAELAAGKTITNPADGSVLFMTPSGLFGQKPGQGPQPVGGGAPGGQAPQAGAPPAAAPGPATQPGMIQVTPGKPIGQPTPKELQDIRTARAEADVLIKSLEDFRAEAKNASIPDRVMSATGATTGLNTSYNIAALLAKGEALFNLGVLNGPDLDIIRRTLPDPSTFRGGSASRDSVNAAVDKVVGIIKSKVEAREKQLGIAPPAAAAPAPAPAQGSADRGRVLFEARDAISKGADPAKVKERLKSLGIEEEP